LDKKDEFAKSLFHCQKNFLSFFQRKKPKKFAKKIGAVNCVVNCLEKPKKLAKKIGALFKKKFAKNIGAVNCVVNCLEKPKSLQKRLESLVVKMCRNCYNFKEKTPKS
jgi:hypothetical protein